MRMWELINGLKIFVSEEEAELIEKLINDETTQLTERDEILAFELVKKGILERIEENGEEQYKVLKKVDAWRD